MKLILFLLLAVQALLVAAQTPVFSNQYTVKGKIFLPYAEIEEPFTAYYDEKANKSRIDYYGDLMQTLQRADLGQFYKLAYMVDSHGDPVRVCFNMAGSPLAAVEVQSVLPDLSNFKLKRSDECRRLSLSKVKVEGNCEEWEYRSTDGQKDNKYVFILKRDSNQLIPIYYLMMGYDSLLGSHYDKYEIVYESYSAGPIDPKIFDIYSKYNCRGFPGPGTQRVPLMNPIREYIRGDFEHIDNDFDEFAKNHKKSYEHDKEHNYRKSIFRQNYRYIMSENRKNVNFQLAVNHLADRTTKEIGLIRGKQSSGAAYNGGQYFDKTKHDLSKIPEQWDWRLLGAVTPVKDQAICGSCWSFGTTGTVEGVYFAKTGRLLKLSQQQLIDCSWSENNNGCDGGEDFRSYEYIIKAGGLSSEDDYGHYLGVDGRCHDKSVKKSVQISGFYNVTQDDPESLKAALFYHGPVTIAIDASLKSFTFYSNGIFYDPKCSSTNLDHQVLAVGYGEINNQKYWLVKNSWSTYWGNDGYVLINQKNNNCGVMTSPTFPILK